MTLIHFTQLIFICHFFFSSNIPGSDTKKIVLKFYIAPLSNKNISLLSAKGYTRKEKLRYHKSKEAGDRPTQERRNRTPDWTCRTSNFSDIRQLGAGALSPPIWI